MAQENKDKEKLIGHWRLSPSSPRFWAHTLPTLGFYFFLLWRRNQITVTTRRVTQRHGNIIGGSETTISLENITDISVSQGILGSLLGYGDVIIQSAGSGAAEISFQSLGDVKRLREVIFDMKDGRLDETGKVGG